MSGPGGHIPLFQSVEGYKLYLESNERIKELRELLKEVKYWGNCLEEGEGDRKVQQIKDEY
jgi:hypothetical protein